MKSSLNTSNYIVSEGKDKQILTQFRKVYKSFYDSPKTMKEADKATGVMRESICRYCQSMRRSNRLYLIGKRICSITNHRANVYTTNPDLVPESPQLKIFDV